MEWWASKALAGRVTTRVANVRPGRPASCARAPSISVSLPAPEGPTTRTSTPVGGPPSAGHSDDTMAPTPDSPHDRDAGHMDPDQVGSFAGCDGAAVVETDSPSRIKRHGRNGLRQLDPRHAPRQLERGQDQTGRDVVGREDVERSVPREILGRDVA